MEDDEGVRASRLLEAQSLAAQLFEAVGTEGLLRPGILEIHLVDHDRQIGGFYEELLTL